MSVVIHFPALARAVPPRCKRVYWTLVTATCETDLLEASRDDAPIIAEFRHAGRCYSYRLRDGRVYLNIPGGGTGAAAAVSRYMSAFVARRAENLGKDEPRLEPRFSKQGNAESGAFGRLTGALGATFALSDILRLAPLPQGSDPSAVSSVETGDLAECEAEARSFAERLLFCEGEYHIEIDDPFLFVNARGRVDVFDRSFYAVNRSRRFSFARIAKDRTSYYDAYGLIGISHGYFDWEAMPVPIFGMNEAVDRLATEGVLGERVGNTMRRFLRDWRKMPTESRSDSSLPALEIGRIGRLVASQIVHDRNYLIPGMTSAARRLSWAATKSSAGDAAADRIADQLEALGPEIRKRRNSFSRARGYALADAVDVAVANWRNRDVALDFGFCPGP